jgi:phosphopantetheinyl transferase
MPEAWKITVPQSFDLKEHDFHLFDFRFSAPLSASDADQTNLSETERQRALKFHHRIDRNRFVVGRNMLRQALALILQVNPVDVPIRVEKGRPFLDPAVSERCFFNLSHSGSSVVLILSPKYPVGIDVEIFRAFPDMDQVARRVMTVGEFADYIDLKPACRGDAFYRLWVRKESILKCMGTGFSIEPDRIYVGHDQDPESEVEFEGERFMLQQNVLSGLEKPHFWAFAYTGVTGPVTPATYQIDGDFG